MRETAELIGVGMATFRVDLHMNEVDILILDLASQRQLVTRSLMPDRACSQQQHRAQLPYEGLFLSISNVVLGNLYMDAVLRHAGQAMHGNKNLIPSLMHL